MLLLHLLHFPSHVQENTLVSSHQVHEHESSKKWKKGKKKVSEKEVAANSLACAKW
jgi:hypothetical protein